MTDVPPASEAPAGETPPEKSAGRAGRNLPVAIASGVTLVVIIIASLVFYKALFMVVVVVAAVVAIWELHRGFQAKDINLPQEPLMAGGVVMLVVAYVEGSAPLVTATAVTGLVTMLWLLRRGVDGFVRDATDHQGLLRDVDVLGHQAAVELPDRDDHGGGHDEHEGGLPERERHRDRGEQHDRRGDAGGEVASRAAVVLLRGRPRRRTGLGHLTPRGARLPCASGGRRSCPCGSWSSRRGASRPR